MRKKRYHWLADLINVQGSKSIVEVGAATGITTEYILKNCPGVEQYTVVDIWEKIEASKQWNRDDMKKLFLDKFKNEKRLQVLEGLSWQMADAISDYSKHLIFIDAAHDYVSFKKDLYAWGDKVAEGGILCGHDLHFPGVRKALEELIPDYHQAGIDNCWYAYFSQLTDLYDI